MGTALVKYFMFSQANTGVAQFHVSQLRMKVRSVALQHVQMTQIYLLMVNYGIYSGVQGYKLTVIV